MRLVQPCTHTCGAPRRTPITAALHAPAAPGTHLLLVAAAPAAKPALVLRSIPAQVSLQRLLPAACCPRCARCAAAAKVAAGRPCRRALCSRRCVCALCAGGRTLGCLPSWHWHWVWDDGHGHEGGEEAAAVAVPAEEVCGVMSRDAPGVVGGRVA